ncbi:hypothetical protein [Lentzea albida]|uniref:Uncharacterized protein n=1 Tax=Lentzea albida TaxID=65499 RepID=A0A1H9AUM7_9PSEU|nr:hypothetical protein [Lentzea albida]SEP80484.1 hypothetical protein SAMN04488000_101298 [Lentzea albida]
MTLPATTDQEIECLTSYLEDAEAAPPDFAGCGCVPFFVAAEAVPRRAVPAQRPTSPPAALTPT